MELKLETRSQRNETPVLGEPGGPSLMSTPPLGEDYWAYRVMLGERQAIIGFPKFTTIGIGFAAEDDWNTNLPFTCAAEDIYEHIRANKGDNGITRGDCLTAIRMIQEAVIAERAGS